MQRRDVLRLGGALALGVWSAASPWRGGLRAAWAGLGACDPEAERHGPYGPLRPPDEHGIMLPAGFSARIVGQAQQPVPGTDYAWHLFPDGGDIFAAPGGGWIYVSNSESIPGGVSAIRFDPSGAIAAAYRICEGTVINCAGGATPWGSWLTCEEHAGGHVWECDPQGRRPAVQRPALGTFQHEAVAVDPHRRVLYLTEDRSDGCFYRFRPARWGDLGAGSLEVAALDAEARVTWLPVPEPNAVTPTPTRHQVPQATAFRGGEGIVYRRRHCFFTTKGDNRVWDYDVVAGTIRPFYDYATDPDRHLRGVDNIGLTPRGELVVAEDGDNMELVLLSRRGTTAPLLRIVEQDFSELCGPAFAGNRLYVSSQRAALGTTYEITGPFRQSWPRPC